MSLVRSEMTARGERREGKIQIIGYRSKISFQLTTCDARAFRIMRDRPRPAQWAASSSSCAQGGGATSNIERQVRRQCGPRVFHCRFKTNSILIFSLFHSLSCVKTTLAVAILCRLTALRPPILPCARRTTKAVAETHDES